MLPLADLLDFVSRFMEAGGTVLWYIALLTFVMWSLVFGISTPLCPRILMLLYSLGKTVASVALGMPSRFVSE